MILTVAERLKLQSVLPAQGDFVTLRIVQRLREALSFSEAEIAAFKLVAEAQLTGSTLYNWDRSADSGSEVEIGEKAMDIIVDSLKRLNGQKQLTMQLLPLYERFVEKAEPFDNVKPFPSRN